MKFLYKLSQTVNENYDTYDSAIVVSDSPENARLIHPSVDFPRPVVLRENYAALDWKDKCSTWGCIEDINVELIGTAADHLELGTVVCASFNAG